MIRIDEIYDGVFVPLVKKIPNTGLHWFDPFGSTNFRDICNRPPVYNFADRRIIMWDQEPLNQNRFKPFIDGMGPWKWSTDQTLLNTWIKEERMRTKHLDWKWNGLYNAVPNNKLHEAHFIHFFHKTVLPMEGENIEELAKLVGIA